MRYRGGSISFTCCPVKAKYSKSINFLQYRSASEYCGTHKVKPRYSRSRHCSDEFTQTCEEKLLGKKKVLGASPSEPETNARYTRHRDKLEHVILRLNCTTIISLCTEMDYWSFAVTGQHGPGRGKDLDAILFSQSHHINSRVTTAVNCWRRPLLFSHNLVETAFSWAEHSTMTFAVKIRRNPLQHCRGRVIFSRSFQKSQFVWAQYLSHGSMFV